MRSVFLKCYGFNLKLLIITSSDVSFMEPYSSDDIKRRKRKRYPDNFYPKDQLCPKCGKFLPNLFKYVDTNEGELTKLYLKEFKPRQKTGKSLDDDDTDLKGGR